jgi:ketosteroid isomerase-like protein
MGAREEIQTITENWLSAFNKGNVTPFIDAFDDDLEVFDTVPYRFDGKPSFVEFLQAGMGALESGSFFLRQPSYRVFNDNTGIVNAYDAFSMAPKGGGTPTTVFGRTTLVYVKRGGQGKIVSGHFSPLPKG